VRRPAGGGPVAADSGVGDAQDELVDFAISATHLSLRSQLGLSIDV
jgi:hypothetical protein